MNSLPPSPMDSSEAGPLFPLLWTLGMSGHRRLPDEAAARVAVRAEIESLSATAATLKARLVAVSSIALGADLIFAEECLEAGLPWKCLLPFPKDEFRKDGFTDTDWARVEHCLARAYRVEVVRADVPPDSSARDLAYLACGHRTVEEADVMLMVWNGKPAEGTGGTGDLWDYTRAMSKPIWHFNPEKGEICRAGWPGSEGEWKQRTLFSSRITSLVTEAESQAVGIPASTPLPPTFTGQGLLRLFIQLDHLANQKQGDAQRLMQRVVLAHLLATTAAALSVTLVPHGVWHSVVHLPLLALLAALAFSFLVVAKPVLAAMALRWDKQLHDFKSQKRWVEARVAAELCRSALVCWSIPQAPLSVFEDEDFPRFKRLIRTLRIARETDIIAKSVCSEDDAIRGYIADRVKDQADYFKDKHEQAVKELTGWQRRFNFATRFVIIVGGFIGLAEAVDACCAACHVPLPSIFNDASHLLHILSPAIAFLLIVAPFYATYALAMLSIRDCRRRKDRYKDMTVFLERQKDRLGRIKSSGSRLAVVVNTERMLLEELHEWHAVTREVHV